MPSVNYQALLNAGHPWGWQPPAASATTGATPTAAAQNTTALPDITSLLQSLNQLNVGAQGAANMARLPGEQALESQSSANIGSELSGQLPESVISLLQQQGAERGVATGSPGSPNSNAAYLQALGLTSLAEQQQGQADLTAAAARNPVAPILNPQQQLITPAQQGQLANEAAGLNLDFLRAFGGTPGIIQGGNVGGSLRMPTSTGTAPTTTTPQLDWSFLSQLYGGGSPTQAPTLGPTATQNTLDPLNPMVDASQQGIDWSNPASWDFTNQATWGTPPLDFAGTDTYDTSAFDPTLYSDTGGG